MLARKRHCFSDDYEAVAHLITIEIAHGHLVLSIMKDGIALRLTAGKVAKFTANLSHFRC